MQHPIDQSYSVQTDRRCAWYCIRSKPKHEHIAARNLRRLEEVEIFNPRFRMRKSTKRGAAWVTESLFPNYLFARFPFHQLLDEVKYTQGVSSVIGFGGQYPEVPADVIDELRQNFPENDLHVADGLPKPGDTVTIATRAMFGLPGVVLRNLPGRQRVQVLLEMLGRTTMLELSLADIVLENRAVPAGLAV